MIVKVDRNYLEINSIKDLKVSKKPSENCKISLIDPPDFQLNKFFYKQVGKNYRWIDRLIWDDSKWINYVQNLNVKTYVLKDSENLVGYFEIILDLKKKQSEIEHVYIRGAKRLRPDLSELPPVDWEELERWISQQMDSV